MDTDRKLPGRDTEDWFDIWFDRQQDTDNVHDAEDTATKSTQDSKNFINFNSF
jgi:hypothetical protein